MIANLRRVLSALELEERILNAGSAVALVGTILMPWISGEWLGGEEIVHTGLGFYTSFIGIAVFLLHLCTLLILLVPLFGGPQLVASNLRHQVRLLCTMFASVLTLASLSVLTNVTLEFTRMELRFGVYVTLVGGLVATLYAYLLYREQRRREVRELFHHPEDLFHRVASTQQPAPGAFNAPPPPPPPPPLPAEEHPVIR